MGRGRAKAKQTKVARYLKYRTFDPYFDQLPRVLQSQSDEADNDSDDSSDGDADEAYDDPYAHDPYAADPHDDDAESTRRS